MKKNAETCTREINGEKSPSAVVASGNVRGALPFTFCVSSNKQRRSITQGVEIRRTGFISHTKTARRSRVTFYKFSRTAHCSYFSSPGPASPGHASRKRLSFPFEVEEDRGCEGPEMLDDAVNEELSFEADGSLVGSSARGSGVSGGGTRGLLAVKPLPSLGFAGNCAVSSICSRVPDSALLLTTRASTGDGSGSTNLASCFFTADDSSPCRSVLDDGSF